MLGDVFHDRVDNPLGQCLLRKFLSYIGGYHVRDFRHPTLGDLHSEHYAHEQDQHALGCFIDFFAVIGE
ncbi:hypothetical protein D9M70_650050 [compost metagenome]